MKIANSFRIPIKVSNKKLSTTKRNYMKELVKLLKGKVKGKERAYKYFQNRRN